MATVGNTVLTYADLAKRMDPNGAIAAIVEILKDTNPILEDMPFMEGNLPTGHLITLRDGLPTAHWRALNEGTPRSKSATRQVTEACGMLHTTCTVDKDLARIDGRVAQLRTSENVAHLQAMNNEMARALFYGDISADVKEFVGLHPRFASLSDTNGAQIVDCDGTGSDNTSIWVITWGEMFAHGIYPKDTESGIVHRDMGEQVVTDSSGNEYIGYQDFFQLKTGLCVKDPRFISRMANIDVSDIADAGESGSSAPDLIMRFVDAFAAIENVDLGNTVIYANKTAHAALTKLALRDSNTQLWVERDIEKKRAITMMMGYPIRRTDAILNTEARIV